MSNQVTGTPRLHKNISNLCYFRPLVSHAFFKFFCLTRSLNKTEYLIELFCFVTRL